MEKIIFLDFDGVVVYDPPQWDYLLDGKKVHGLSRRAVGQLNKIIEDTGANVVVSSSWRLHESHEYLLSYLKRAGFEGKLVGVTPDMATIGGRLGLVFEAKERGHEIEAYLKMHPYVECYVVLDDDSDRGPIPEFRWVQVKDGWRHGGLQALHAQEAIAILNGYETRP